MKKVKLLVALFCVVAYFTLTSSSCEYTPTSDEQAAAKQELLTKEANKQVGLPAIVNFQEKRNLKMIYELRDNEKMICYAYLFNEFSGKLIYLGKCLGYGIPYATQFSNPMKTHSSYTQGGFEILPQAEPNGLFMPSSASGTWVMLLDDKGEPHPVYVEPNVIVSPFKLSI
jgi:hypothetical protein